MWKYSLIVLLLWLLPTVATAETYVVCVGIGNYSDPKVPNLSKTEKDARAMTEFYRKGTKNVITVTGKYATKDKILECLRSQFGRAKKGDKIVFYFSGHGYAGGFAPYDMRSAADGLSYDEVLKIMGASKATDKFIFADACMSGAIRRNKAQKSPAPEAGSVLFFMSSRNDESSLESSFSANGFFTKHLLRGLAGGADADADRRITASELFEFVSKGVKADTDDKQHPVMWGKFPHDLVIVKYQKK